MSENKYNIYTSKAPTNGDSSTRSFKRREWKNSWVNFYANEGLNFNRTARRSAWKLHWELN
jgi:hypothetical protein